MIEDALERGDPADAAARLLGAELTCGGVTVRIVEVEAYGGVVDGPWPDPASHSFRGRTPRSAIMFGPAGRLYVYLSYGMHLCLNVTCGPDGTAGAVLLRAGEVVDGIEAAGRRRPSVRSPTLLGSGPGNLGKILDISLSDNGSRLFDRRSTPFLRLADRPIEPAVGPRVGVSVAAERGWRFWIPGSPAVSAYRRSPRAPVAGSAAGQLGSAGRLTGE